MLRHPFDLISKRYQLRTFFQVMTGVCLALWLATFTLGQIVLGFLAAVTSLILALACATWVLGTFGEQQKRADDAIMNITGDEAPPQQQEKLRSPATSTDSFAC